MARATAVPTAVSSTSRATLDCTRVKKVMLASRPRRTSYARSGTLDVARDLDDVGAAGPPLAGANVPGRADGSANCCWRTCAGGGPRRRGVVAA